MPSPGRLKCPAESDIDVRVFCDPDNVYEYHGGEPTLIAAGMLLENMRIAAATLGRRAELDLSAAPQGTQPSHLRLRLDDDVAPPDPLYGAIYTSAPSTAGLISKRPLDAAAKQALGSRRGQ